jgi:hypothetical protein
VSSKSNRSTGSRQYQIIIQVCSSSTFDIVGRKTGFVVSLFEQVVSK